MRRSARVGTPFVVMGFLVALVLVGLGLGLAAWDHTRGGDIAVETTTIEAAGDVDLDATVYAPTSASEDDPAPAVLLVHAFTLDRTTMSHFARELADRGYVAVTVDQPGHGRSDPPLDANDRGGPAALAYTRNRSDVDGSQVALVGHSAGGSAVLRATVDQPEGYQSITLVGATWNTSEGSADPTPNHTFPRNLAVIFGAYDEFSPIMYGESVPKNVDESEKLGTPFPRDTVTPGTVQGSIENGTGRYFANPVTTHTTVELSPPTVREVLGWVMATTETPDPAPPTAQRWYVGTLGGVIAFLGALGVALTTTALLWRLLAARLLGGSGGPRTGPRGSRLSTTGGTVGTGQTATSSGAGGPAVAGPTLFGFSRRWGLAMAALPALTIYPLYGLGTLGVPVTGLTHQQFLHGYLVWALGTIGIAAGLHRLRQRGLPAIGIDDLSRQTLSLPSRGAVLDRVQKTVARRVPARSRIPALTRLVAGVGAGVGGFLASYLLALVAYWLYAGALDGWMVKLLALSPVRVVSLLVYAAPLTVTTLLLARWLRRTQPRKPLHRRLGRNLALTCGGLLVFLAFQYGPLFLGAGIPAAPLGPVATRAIRGTILLGTTTAVMTGVTSLTERPLPAGVCGGLLATWMLVSTEPIPVAVL